MLPILPVAGMPPGNLQVGNSLRMRYGASGNLTRTPSLGNRKTWTFSFWVKRGSRLGVYETILNCNNGTGDSFCNLSFYNDCLSFGSYYTNYRITNQVFRDPNAWYHIIIAVDTTQATGQNRVRVYVNGVEITSFSTNNHPTLNADLGILQNASHTIGGNVAGSGSNIDAVFSEVHLVEGLQLTPPSFGKNDTISGEWVPKRYVGSYGTNGFRLDFSDTSAATAAAIGADRSGNGNNWTPNNISVATDYTRDALLDTPTNNCMVLDGLAKENYTILSDSNQRFTLTGTSNGAGRYGTMPLPKSGKWYWEVTNLVANPYYAATGILDASGVRDYRGIGWNRSGYGTTLTAYGLVSSQYGPHDKQAFSDTDTFMNATAPVWSAATSPMAANAVIMHAYDADNGKYWIGMDGTWFNTSGTANPATGTDPHWTPSTSIAFQPFVYGYYSTYPDLATNFGQRAFAYSPPTGFKAPTTQNMAAATIKKPNSYFNSVAYVGNNATQAIGVGFQPDLVWIKRRDAALSHCLYDSTRGTSARLSSNSTAAEDNPGGFASFDVNGFSLAADANGAVNANGASFVAWCWKKGATPGFDIVSYTGSGANRTINHALGVAPKLMIIKCRSSNPDDWIAYHSGLNSTTQFLRFSTSAAAASDGGTLWNSTAPTSSVFSLGSGSAVNMNAQTFIAYLFAEVPGFSKFGFYQGTGSSDGQFVNCGFRPALVIFKRTDSSYGWCMFDTAREPNNPKILDIEAEVVNAENISSSDDIDFVSNGFKIRNVKSGYNVSGGTYVFAAFAEMPVQSPANAR